MNDFLRNYVQTTLGELCVLDNGVKVHGEKLPLLDVKYLRGKKEAEYLDSGVVLNDGQYAILVDGENSGEVFRIHETGYMGSTFKRLACPDNRLLEYLLYIIKFNQKMFRENKKGSAIPHLDKKLFKELSINLPPLAEQGRIVAKIEELFAGIDAGVENLKSVKNQIALYRQSVLKSAFLKVTAWEKLSNICLVIKVGPFGTMLHEADYISNGIPLVNPSQIKNSKILPKQDKCISPQKAEELKEYRLMQGDIVLGRRGEMGRCATVDEMEVGWLCGTGSILIRLKKQMNALFYNFFLASPLNVRYLEDNATGTTMKNLNEKIVANIPVPVPTLAEQKRIVAEIESRFERADALETAVDRALNDAEKLKQAVLKKAFSGELVPQNPDDEPASVLLDRIRAARASELPANPKKGKRK